MKYFYCNVCGQPQEHSFSSSCCGAIVKNEDGDTVLNIETDENDSK